MNYWLKLLSTLLGGKITGLAESPDEEFGENFYGLEIELPNKSKKILWFLSDEEGNAPGRFEIDNANKHAA